MRNTRVIRHEIINSVDSTLIILCKTSRLNNKTVHGGAPGGLDEWVVGTWGCVPTRSDQRLSYKPGINSFLAVLVAWHSGSGII